MTTHSLTLSPHEVRAALRGELGLIVRPVNGLGGTRPENKLAKCPLGVPGARLVCKEGWADVNTESGPAFTYRADNGLHFCQDDAFPVEYDRYPGMKFTMWCGDLWRGEPGHSWRSPATMPAWASRITLEVEDVRCCRVQDLTVEDFIACGFSTQLREHEALCHLKEQFRDAWSSHYGRRYPWESNLWCWAVGVRRVEG